MSRQTILIVEDEEDIQQLVSYHMIREGFFVKCADTGEDGLRIFSSEDVALVILDLMLPGIDGLQVCRRIRQMGDGRPVPVIMLTAKGEERDIIEGLEAGADDYITKPFSPRVLVARVKAHLRREEELRAGTREKKGRMRLPMGLEIASDLHRVTLDGKSIELTVTEFDTLLFLASRPERVFSRQQIIDEIRGYGHVVTSRSVDVHIHGLRKKLKQAGSLIETVRGVGYRFRGEERCTKES